MNGTIDFDNLADLAEFLGEFTGKSTAVFRVRPHGYNGGWRLEFTGGY